MLKLNWKESFGYIFREEGWRRNIGYAGLVLLLLPALGWYLAMGYRKQVAFHLVTGTSPLLPDFLGTWRENLRSGLQATGVIFLYLIPFFLLYWILGGTSARAFLKNLHMVAGFFLTLFLLPPILIPGLPVLAEYSLEWVHLTATEWGVLGVVFAGTVFCMPAVFLQVSLTGRFTGAFAFRNVLSFLYKNWKEYVEAWLMSLIATVISVVSLPFFFWTVIWSYMVIVHAFNQVLFQSNLPGVEERFSNSYFCRK